MSTAIKLIKEMLPQVAVRDRKRLVNSIAHQCKITGKTDLFFITEMKKLYDTQVEKDKQKYLNKMLTTALLVEFNDELKGTTLEDYHTEITAGVGKKFMNAQYKLYNTRYHSFTHGNSENTNFIINLLERGVKILTKSIKRDNTDIFNILELAQEDETFANRLNGIYKQHLKK